MAASFLRRHKLVLLNVSSGSGLLALGDLFAQVFYEKKKHVDDKRLGMFIDASFVTTHALILVAACITGAVMGLEGHVWYAFLDRIIAEATWRNVFKKVLLDQALAAPLYTSTYIIGTRHTGLRPCEATTRSFHSGSSLLEGRTSFGELKHDFRSNFLPMYLADCAVFIPIQIINFKYVPAYYRVSFMFLIACIFNTFISAYKHAGDDTHEK